MTSRAGHPGPARRPSRRRRHRLVAVLLTVLVAITSAVAALMIRSAYEGRKAVIVHRFNTRHVTASRFVEAYVRQILAEKARLARRTLTAPRIDQDDFDRLTTLGQLDQAVVYDAQGVPLVHSTAGSAAGNGSDPGPAEALAGHPAVAAVLGPGDVAPMIAFAVPFESTSGPRVFAGRYPVAQSLLPSFVTDALPTYRTDRVYLVSATGLVVAAEQQDQTGLSLSRAVPALAPLPAGSRHGSLPGTHTYYVTGPITGTTWSLVFILDTPELFETLTPNQKYSPWAALAGFDVMALIVIAMFVRALAGRARAEEEHARQDAILDTAGDAFVGLDSAGRVTDWNRAAHVLFGWTRAEALGRDGIDLIHPPGDRPAARAAFQRFLETGVAPGPQATALTAQHRDGQQIPVEMAVARSHWQGSWRFHSFIRDISHRLAYEQQLQEMALTDPLTGLANRRAFLEALEQAYARSVRHGTGLAVLYGDVDHFKAINDNLGHAAGDSVLRQVAARLRSHFRTEDTVGRLGGDEFAIICEDFDPLTGGLMERLQAVLAVPYSYRDEPLTVGVSVGLAVARDGESIAQLLERADTTMYRVKSSSR